VGAVAAGGEPPGRALPLQPEEALLAAAAARVTGDRPAELRHLRRAAEAGSLAEVARLELAEALVGSDAAAALDLALPILGAAETRAMREGSGRVAAEAVASGVAAAARSAVERSLRTLPAELRRPLELALARTDAAGGRARPSACSTPRSGDLVALDGPAGLQALGSLSAEERWLVAQCLFQHRSLPRGRADPHELDGAESRAVRGEVAFLAGRLAFPRGRLRRGGSALPRCVDPDLRRRATRPSSKLHLARGA